MDCLFAVRSVQSTRPFYVCSWLSSTRPNEATRAIQSTSILTPSIIAEAQVEKCPACVILGCGRPHTGACTGNTSREGRRGQPATLENGLDICEYPSGLNKLIQSLLVDPVRVALWRSKRVIR